MSRILLTFVGISLIGIGGCRSKVEYEDTFTAQPSQTTIKIIEPGKQDQTVRVEATSDNPIHIAAILSKDASEAAAINFVGGSKVSNLLGEQKNTTNASFDIDVPAKEGFHIYITPVGEKAEVTLKANTL